MNRLSDYYSLKEDLKEKKNELWRLQQEYNSIVQQEPYMRGRLKNRQHTIYKLAGEIKSIEKELKNMEKAHLQDSMDMLKLMGLTVDANCEKIYTKGESTKDQCKDDDATEMGTFEQLGQNHETEAMEPSDNPVQAQDAEEQWITINGTHVKIEEGQSKEEAAKNFIGKKKGNKSSSKTNGSSSQKEESPKKEESLSKPKTPKKKDKSEIKEGNTLRNSEGKRIGKIEKVFKNIRGEEMVKAMKSSESYFPSYVRKSDVDNMAWTNTQKATPQEKEEFKKDVSKLSDLQHRYALADLIADSLHGWRSVDAEKELGEDGEKLSGEDKKLYDKIKEDYNKNGGNTHIAWDLKYEFREAENNLREKYMGLDLPIYTFGNVSWHEAKEKVSGKSPSKDSDPKVAEANKLINLFGGAM